MHWLSDSFENAKIFKTIPHILSLPISAKATFPYCCIVFPIFRASRILKKYVHTTYSTLNLGKNVTIKERSSLLKNNVNCTQFCSALIYCALVQNALHWIFLSLKASIQFMVQVDFLPEIKSGWKKKTTNAKGIRDSNELEKKLQCTYLLLTANIKILSILFFFFWTDFAHFF